MASRGVATLASPLTDAQKQVALGFKLPAGPQPTSAAVAPDARSPFAAPDKIPSPGQDVTISFDLEELLAPLKAQLTSSGHTNDNSPALRALTNTFLTLNLTKNGECEATVHQTFKPYRKLPVELYVKILNLIVTPRIVEVRVSRRDAFPIRHRNPYEFTTPTPVPAVLHVNQEIRAEFQKKYKKTFITTSARYNRYIYIHSEIDVAWLSPINKGIGPRQSPASVVHGALEGIADYNPESLPMITHLAIPMVPPRPSKPEHVQLLMLGVAHCFALKELILVTNNLPCTPHLDVHLMKRRPKGELGFAPSRFYSSSHFDSSMTEYTLEWYSDCLKKCSKYLGFRPLEIVVHNNTYASDNRENDGDGQVSGRILNMKAVTMVSKM